MSSPSIWPRPARERHSRPPVQLQQSAIERPGMEPRDFELLDPNWMRDLSHCPLSDRDKELLEKFWTELENDRMENCVRCQEIWFDMGLKDGVCITENDDIEPDEVNQSAVPDLLPEDTEIEALHSHILGEERDEPIPV
ncbi:uncharacterized protein NECHADRAFT_85446 [Fusarium vanettenii 77-13-4]|uniref:Uncharacterized protein n=1 Tax=Fusarium vanettenii (strain ATCC MYA-4622 / CBS 123669 / FGSC 9596 / NRRL 45880 / 77-13-4) TaxID=660122 RepID=C7ZNN1_FUSV7|nr:uncharacterized protein NECHADRAFT_85446 [Fusarium vanettenii 77-13-4]EEU34018.1 hypothetical protein NECHADRAFT_85446 [Fusarium vanettenii 77-13-4]